MKKLTIFKKTEKFYMVLIFVGLLLTGVGSVIGGNAVDNRFFEFAGGLGCAAIGIGSVCLIRMKRNPKTAQQQEIEKNDERNIKIKEKSAYTTFFVTLLSLLAVEIAFLILDIWWACLVVILIMTIHIGSFFAGIFINNKRL